MYKLVLVEDERETREGILRSIQGTGFEVAGEAENGEEALALVLEQRPEVLMTDITMPKMGGIELIERIREENLDTQIVVVSGYDDFEYVQKALQNGVRDYLLKPVLPEQIREVLAKARADIERHKGFLDDLEGLKRRAGESLPLFRERFFNELVQGRLSPPQIQEKLRHLQLNLTGELFQVLLLKIDPSGQKRDPRISGGEVVLFFLNDLVRDIFPGNFMVQLFAESDSQIVLLASVKGLEPEQVFVSTSHYAARLLRALQSFLGVSAYASLGKVYHRLEDIAKSYNEAAEAMVFSFSRKGGTVLSYEDVSFQKGFTLKRPLHLEEDLILGIKLCQRDESRRCLLRLFEFYAESGVTNPIALKMDITELLVHIFDRLDGVGDNPAEFLQQLKWSAYEGVHRCGSLDEIKTWTADFLDRLTNDLERMRMQRTMSRIDKALELIRLNLGDPGFSLDDVVSRIYISPNYLRQMFKQQTGESFVECLTRTRMERAAELLADPTMKVQEIARAVGYTNQRYFAACFKRQFGVTPSEYRAVRLQQNQGG